MRILEPLAKNSESEASFTKENSQYVYNENGLVIENHCLIKVNPNVRKINIPSDVTSISNDAFCECKLIEEIISESVLYAVKNGCLYDVKNGILIATICGDVVVPREIKGVTSYSLNNCGDISFEDLKTASKGFFSIVMENDLFDSESYYKIDEAVKKAEMKKKKMMQMSEATAEAYLKHINSLYHIQLEHYQTDDNATVIVIPIGDCVIEVKLSNDEIKQWSQVLPPLFDIIAKNVGLDRIIDYCDDRHLTLLFNKARQYAVLPRGLIELNSHSVDKMRAGSLIIPVSIRKIRTDLNDRMYVKYIGTIKQWENVKGKARLIGQTIHCIDGDYENVGCVIEDNILTGIDETADSLVLPADIEKIDINYPLLPYYFHNYDNYEFHSLDITFCGTKEKWHTVKGRSTFEYYMCYCCDVIHCLDGDIEMPEAVVNNVLLSLKSCTIPDGVTKIADNAILYLNENKSKLSDKRETLDLTVPSSIKEISKDVFINMREFKSIIYKGTVSQWNMIQGKHWFECCTPSVTVHCTDGIIEDRTITYNEDKSVARVADGVRMITVTGNIAQIKTIIIPDSVVFISDGMFTHLQWADITFCGTTLQWLAIEKRWDGIMCCINLHCTDGDAIIM